MHFFERYDRFFESSSVGTHLADGTRSPRLRYRHKSIIECNRSLFPGARVLDLGSHDGRWSLAALDAGAALVLGIEGRQHLVEAANENLAAYHVASSRYSFKQGDVLSVMAMLAPDSFEVILCLGIFYHTARHYEFFEQFYRLRASYVILDTAIEQLEGISVHFKYENDGDAKALLSKGFSRSLVGFPTHGMIAMLCDHFRFTWRTIDWTSLGIERWEGMNDYQDDSRRTYVLSCVEP
jgi:hypothetical protein